MGEAQTREASMTIPPVPPGPLQPPGPPPPLPDPPLPDPSPSEPDPIPDPDPDTSPEPPRQPKPAFLWHPRAFEPIAAAGLDEVSVDKMGRNHPEIIRMYAEQVLPELDRSAASGGSSS